MQQTMLNKDGDMFYPAANIIWYGTPTMAERNDSLIFTGCIKNIGDAALQLPIHITYYANDTIPANIIKMDTIPRVLSAGATLCFESVFDDICIYDTIWISVNDNNGDYPYQAQCEVNGRYPFTGCANSVTYGTVFPNVHHRQTTPEKEIIKLLNTQFAVTAKLYPVPALGSTADPIKSVLDSTPLAETQIKHYIPSADLKAGANPGNILHLDNPGIPIHWNLLFGENAPTTPPYIELPLMETFEEDETTFIGMYVFEDVPEGDYILALSRAGCVSRFAEVHIGATGGSCGHRELILGDVNGDGEVNTEDLRLIGENAASFSDEGYDSRYDLNADGKVDAADISTARAFLGFKAVFYSDTKTWVDKYK
jgi:hypothetical protein